MKGILFTILTFFMFQFGFSQTEKLLSGKVSDKEFPIKGVDVINFTTQKSAATNSNGVFHILAKANDVILIHHKNYIDQKITVSQKDITSDGFEVVLVVKPTELEEVVIDQGQSMHIALTQADIDGMKLLKDQSKAKVVGINDGSIPNGVDFVRVGKGAYNMIKKMFKSKSKDSKEDSEIAFKKYVATNINKDYFIRNLKLQPNEIPLFLDFCEADSKSKIISKQANVLSTMDFLLAKNIEFQKVLTLVK